MTNYFCCVTYISRNVISGKQTQGQSVLAKLQMGVAGIMGYLGGGFILNRIGYQKTYFLFSVAVFLLCTVNYILYLFYKKKKLVRSIE
jgi:predicted MFS family arabinose efflux permease